MGWGFNVGRNMTLQFDVMHRFPRRERKRVNLIFPFTRIQGAFSLSGHRFLGKIGDARV
jgi:hypothetical protein